jgi:YggT family protein
VPACEHRAVAAERASRWREGAAVEFLVRFLDILLWVLQIAIIARALFSWFDPAGRTTISRILIDVTEPIVRPIRQVMPQTGMIDLSPLVALLLIFLLQTILGNVVRGR